MRVLFDQATPLPIRAHLDQHVVSTAFAEGWNTLKNGELKKSSALSPTASRSARIS